MAPPPAATDPGGKASPQGADEAARRRRTADGAKGPVLPDCCNLGTALRVIVPINVGAIVIAIALAGDWGGILPHMLQIGVVLEPVLLGSLALLCASRRVVNGLPRPLQWLVAIGLPTLLTVLVAVFAGRLMVPDLPTQQFVYWVFGRAVITAGVVWVLVEYFRLRARAYSPSLSEARLQALQARIRPHFLFNSLNTVLGLMRSDPRRAESTLENLADLFRVFMRDTRELVALDDEVVSCQQYLAIEQLRLGERLGVKWELDDMPGDALLPSLLLQPLIENAVHHGIEPRTDRGEVRIMVARLGERVRVEIDNPIAPHAPSRPGNQMALSNVRERLMLLYDMEAELKTTIEEGQFRLFVEFPYRKERRRRDVRRYFNPDR